MTSAKTFDTVYPPLKCPRTGRRIPKQSPRTVPVSQPVPEPSHKAPKFVGKPLVVKPPNAPLPEQPQSISCSHSVIFAPRAIPSPAPHTQPVKTPTVKFAGTKFTPDKPRPKLIKPRPRAVMVVPVCDCPMCRPED